MSIARGFVQPHNHKVDMSKCVVGTAYSASLDDNTHIIIMAPDSETLNRAIAELGINKEELNPGEVGLAIYRAEELQTETEVVELIWMYHVPSDTVCVGDRSVLLNDDITEIGPASECTTIEAKRGLVALGWNREDVRQVTITEYIAWCGECGAPVYNSPSGKVCINGHGGLV